MQWSIWHLSNMPCITLYAAFGFSTNCLSQNFANSSQYVIWSNQSTVCTCAWKFTRFAHSNFMCMYKHLTKFVISVARLATCKEWLAVPALFQNYIKKYLSRSSLSTTLALVASSQSLCTQKWTAFSTAFESAGSIKRNAPYNCNIPNNSKLHSASPCKLFFHYL